VALLVGLPDSPQVNESGVSPIDIIPPWKILHAIVTSITRATYPAHLSRLDLSICINIVKVLYSLQPNSVCWLYDPKNEMKR
jgi:hypothetical protein